MSVNRYHPHVLVLPEDDANRQLATGFQLGLDSSFVRSMHVLPPAGGWTRVMERFLSDHVAEMERCLHRFVVLLIDFDGDDGRLESVKARIPRHLIDRVYVLGALTEPEGLKRVLGSYESIGSAMAKDCREQTNSTWGHDLLRHNAGELDRLREPARSILFESL